MKITLVGDYPPPLGGIAVHVKQLHAFLKEAGFPATVLDIGKGKHELEDVTPVRSWLDYAKHVSQLAASDGIVHLHMSGNNKKAWAVAASLGATVHPNARRVLTVHSGLMPTFAAENEVLVRTACRGYQRIIAVSGAVKDALLGCDVPENRVVVHPAFLASQVRPGALPSEFAAIRSRRQPLLAYAHHPSKVYGRELMFEALKRLSRKYPELGLAVFGPGTREAEFAAEAERAGVTGLLEDFGELPHEQTVAVMAACDAFVRPTTADGDSISVREALTLGVPCIASDVCARPDGTTTFKAQDPEALCDAICAALAKGPTTVPAVDAGPFVLDVYRAIAAKDVRGPIRIAG